MLLSGGGAPLNTRRIDCTVKASGYAPNIPGLHNIQKALLSLHGISGLPSAFRFHRRGGVGAVISGVEYCITIWYPTRTCGCVIVACFTRIRALRDGLWSSLCGIRSLPSPLMGYQRGLRSLGLYELPCLPWTTVLDRIKDAPPSRTHP